MLTKKLQKIGNSVGLILPRSLVEAADLAVGDEVAIGVHGRRIVIEATNPWMSGEEFATAYADVLARHGEEFRLLAEYDRTGRREPRHALMRTDFRFLSPEQVAALHADLLSRVGGSTIVGHRGEREDVIAAVNAVMNSYYNDPYDLAAAYAVYIVMMGHVFGDGNKRTAAAAALAFLRHNVGPVEIELGDLRDLMVDVQARVEDEARAHVAELVASVAAWLRKRVTL